jgi:hypothetical protein
LNLSSAITSHPLCHHQLLYPSCPSRRVPHLEKPQASPRQSAKRSTLHLPSRHLLPLRNDSARRGQPVNPSTVSTTNLRDRHRLDPSSSVFLPHQEVSSSYLNTLVFIPQAPLISSLANSLASIHTHGFCTCYQSSSFIYCIVRIFSCL